MSYVYPVVVDLRVSDEATRASVGAEPDNIEPATVRNARLRSAAMYGGIAVAAIASATFIDQSWRYLLYVFGALGAFGGLAAFQVTKAARTPEQALLQFARLVTPGNSDDVSQAYMLLDPVARRSASVAAFVSAANELREKLGRLVLSGAAGAPIFEQSLARFPKPIAETNGVWDGYVLIDLGAKVLVGNQHAYCSPVRIAYRASVVRLADGKFALATGRFQPKPLQDDSLQDLRAIFEAEARQLKEAEIVSAMRS